MEAILLAGGYGTRLRPTLPPTLPKPLAPIRGRPCLTYVLDHLVKQGITRCVLAVDYCHEAIVQHLGRRYKTLTIDYAIGDTPHGTGTALLQAAEMITHSPFLLQNSDTLFPIDFNRFTQLHQATHAELTLALAQVKLNTRFAGVTTDKTHHIKAFNVEPTRSTLINGGIYLIEKALLTSQPWQTTAPLSLEHQLFPEWLESGRRLYGMVFDEPFIDIGTPEAYCRAGEMIEQG